MTIFDKYQIEVNNIIRKCTLSMNTTLVPVVEYSLLGGKRMRPIILMSIGKNIGIQNKVLEPFVNMIEFLHSASLILDDLPCMDDDCYRRDIPSVHHKFGVKIAYITANLMINSAIKEVYKMIPVTTDMTNSKNKNRWVISRIVTIILDNNSKLAIGQLLDLDNTLDISKSEYIIKSIKTNRYIVELSEVVCLDTLIAYNLKTFPLFYLSFQIPFLLCVDTFLNNEQIIEYYTNERVTYLSFLFSILFQMADDFDDYITDVNEGRTNYIYSIGYKKSLDLFWYCRDRFVECIELLDNKVLMIIVQKLCKKIVSNDKINGK